MAWDRRQAYVRVLPKFIRWGPYGFEADLRHKRFELIQLTHELTMDEIQK